jgi:fructose-1,6-bisphosphatase I
MSGIKLDAYLKSCSNELGSLGDDIIKTINVLSEASISIRNLINQGALGTIFSGVKGASNSDGDLQKDLDVYADDTFLGALRDAPVAIYGSEELANPVLLNPDAKIAVALDPLDGSSNIDTNVSIGTIFSILPVIGNLDEGFDKTFLQCGNNQLAAGFFIYGPQLALVLTIGHGTLIFVHSSISGDFVKAYDKVSIAERTSEFAINASNYRHWSDAIRLYMDDCFAGTSGPRQREFNMRWIASLVADTYRILIRGGVFLYPSDNRKGYGAGRLRLVYEANPIAFIIEQAGGSATNAIDRILGLTPNDLHQRVPFIFGSKKEVERIRRYHIDPSMIGERAPLFGNRGLFRK